MNIAAYCRVSTDTSDQMNSLGAQKNFFSEYAEKNGHTLVRVYSDEGISGTKIKKRVGFQMLMNDAKRGMFDMVVVKDISRFARNTVDLLQSIRSLKRLGIETSFITTNMKALGQSEFVLTIFGALAQEESANTSRRVKFGKKLNAKKGRVPNLVYGYDKTIGDYFNLVINQSEASVVQQIYKWYIYDGYGAARIANLLNERGKATKRNCTWTQTAVCRILTNELYTGKIINGKQEVADFLTGVRADKDETEWLVTERSDLRIIEPEAFEKARHIMKSRGQAFKVNGERQSNKYLFSTLIKCKECGWSFRRSVRKYKNTYVRWVCSGHNGKGAKSCSNAVTIDEDELIETLESYFIGLFKAENNTVKSVANEMSRLYIDKSVNNNNEKKLKDKLAKLQRMRKKYMDMYADDLITREELNNKVDGLRGEAERLENELQLARHANICVEQLEDIATQTFSKVEDIISVKDITNSRIKQIVKKIEVDDNGCVEIYLRIVDELNLDENYLICDN